MSGAVWNGIGRRATPGDDAGLGTEWNDRLFAGAGNDTVAGFAGDDWLNAGDGHDSMDGGAGADTLIGGVGADSLDGGADNDRLQGDAGRDYLHGGGGDDTLLGGAGDDTILACPGNDLVDAGNGNDIVRGAEGEDTILLGAGHDLARGGDGSDRIFGDSGNDTIFAEWSADFVEGGSGRDKIAGNDGNDTLFGGVDRDSLWGGQGSDVLAGGDGADLLVGGMGADTMSGGTGNDFILSRSDAGEPELADGSARVWGDLILEPSDDVLKGGSGADIFRFEFTMNARPSIAQENARVDGTVDWTMVRLENQHRHDHWMDSIGNDSILDYSRAEGDRIELSAHTVSVDSITYGDANADGVNDWSVIVLVARQGGNGAHHMDLIGTITIFGDLVRVEDVIDLGGHYGAFDALADLPYRYEDAGILPSGRWDSDVATVVYDRHAH
jgi:Ca2+-binding RTX toxin-like protein